jgi:O-acetyl-ADP-ribose deacetylase (regulator of RNase III)
MNINSRVVKRAGFKQMKKELKYLLVNNKVEVGKIYRTSAGKMKNSKYIYHSYLPPW